MSPQPDPRLDPSRLVQAPRGTTLHCKSWVTEAAYRMIQNNLDAQVAENPQHLVVYGGIGRAARDWASFDQILASLKELEDDESLLIQSGKPVGVFKTHPDAPRVLLANSNLVPKWAHWEHFNLSGKWILTSGLGGMGAAQPLAATLAGACCLVIECQQSSIDFRLRTRYVDQQARDIDHALELIGQHTRSKQAVSIALLGNAADVLPELVRRAQAGGLRPDIVTDQTSAHDLVHGYLPQGWTAAQWKAAQKEPTQHGAIRAAAARSCARHVQALLDFHAMGIPTVDYGNNIRQVAYDEGVKNAFDFPGFVPAYIRPMFCEGKGPFRWVALSGDPQDIYKTDAKIKELFPHNHHTHRWLDMAREKIAFQGLPARICWLGLGERHVAGLAFNAMVRSGELKAPIVIGRDHLDTGSVASPNRETEAMKDGTDAVSDWPLLNALLNTAGGASWVSLHHGGGVGMGYSQHAGMVIVADGSDAAEKRLARVLVNDCASGVMRHADAGYELALATAHKHGLKLPMLPPAPQPAQRSERN